MDIKAKKILNIININGGEARIVGGYVRDKLLKLKTADIDIASTLLPKECTALFKSLGYKVIPTGVDFGTVTVVFEGKPFEITTLREDIKCDGRHAEVTYTKDFAEDAKRRDFTFNALYMDESGKIYDYFNGQEDLKSGAVRFIGDAEERIKEDYLRILRMFRFHARYGKGNILTEQLAVCSSLKAGLAKISGERIHQEMFKILSNKKQINSLEQMVSSEILEFISNVSVDKIDISNLAKLIDLYDAQQEVAPLTVMALIFDIDSAEILFDRWRLSKKELMLLNKLLSSKQIDLQDDYLARKNLRINGAEEFLEIINLAFASGKIDEGVYKNLKENALNYVPITSPVTSSDLGDLGVVPGKKMGQLLKQAEIIWEKSNYQKTKEQIINEIEVN